jgi:hypothetical protein
MAPRNRQYGKDYPPSWCQFGVYVSDSGGSFEEVCCAYCGERYTDIDHVLPWSWFEKIANTEPGDYWTWLVPSCSECNNIAGDQIFATPALKREYVQSRLMARYDFAFASDRWTQEEIDELGPNLKQFVRANQAKAENVVERVEYDGPLPPTLGSASLTKMVNGMLKGSR